MREWALTKLKREWTERIRTVLLDLAREKGLLLDEVGLVAQRPPSSQFGDVAFPLFGFAKVFRTAPQKIAEEVVARLLPEGGVKKIEGAGGYVNLFLDRESFALSVLSDIAHAGPGYGAGTLHQDKRIMVEFSCPNTNKPLHLGHMRNNILGESVSRILASQGADVLKVNLINDRGIHICKSMLAYKKFGEGKTPEEVGKKPDHFVGDFYVKFNEWAKTDSTAEEQARRMLKAWEDGDPEVRALWEKMNRWAIEGIEQTYRRTGISFDKIYYESDTYLLGRDLVLKGLEAGVFYQEEDGSVWVDLSEIGLDKKVLLRSDGTSLYLTQDLGTAVARYQDWAFDLLIYVVASEQNYHFRVLFYVLGKLGFSWAKNLYHLSYGMVNLPEGKMKSREGTVVDADDLLDRLVEMAREEIREKGRVDEVEDIDRTAEAIALGALHYFLLQVSPNKDMIFNPKESLSLTGNTGPYLQYMGARICSMERKADPSLVVPVEEVPTAELVDDASWELIVLLSQFPEVVESAAREYNPSLVIGFLYELGKTFSSFYHDNPIITHPNKDTARARLALARGIRQVLENGFRLVNIPFLERM